MTIQFSKETIIEVYSSDDGREKKKQMYKILEDREITCCTNQHDDWNTHSIWKRDRNGIKIRRG